MSAKPATLPTTLPTTVGVGGVPLLELAAPAATDDSADGGTVAAGPPPPPPRRDVDGAFDEVGVGVRVDDEVLDVDDDEDCVEEDEDDDVLFRLEELLSNVPVLG